MALYEQLRSNCAYNSKACINDTREADVSSISQSKEIRVIIGYIKLWVFEMLIRLVACPLTGMSKFPFVYPT